MSPVTPSLRPLASTTIISTGGRPVAMRVREVALEVVAGPSAGQNAALARRAFSIGSHPSNDLALTDATVSRFHCRIVIDDDGYRITDTRSANGTFVNNLRVRDAYLTDGARIDLGATSLVVRFGERESEVELSPDDFFGGAVGRSVKMREAFAVARRVAATASTVLVLGETGTGKDVLARAIHDHSPRASGPFVVFDSGAVSPTLIESALFGHERGAFTGADSAHPGVFERASGGTLFLDEIGELPLALQPKLLRALESGVVTRLGGREEIRVDVRVIAATNRDLRDMVAEERFRSDLYYRLAVIPLELPPLRDRPEDIPVLAAYFLRDVLGREGDFARLRSHLDEAFGSLARYRWPGNVRELRNVIERAAALADPRELAKDGLSRLVELRASIGRTLRTRPPLKIAREQFDREYLRDVLAAASGDSERAAELAEIHPKSFQRLLRRYGLPRE